MELHELIRALEAIAATHGSLYVENQKGVLVRVDVQVKNGETVVVIS